MPFTEILAILGLGFGAALGFGALIAPGWASGIVRLMADPARGGGYSEFRATYGGLLLMVHLVTLVLVLVTPRAGSALVVMPLAAAWMGAALGRAVSLLLDRQKLGDTRIIPVWMATEVALALAIGAPVLQFLV